MIYAYINASVVSFPLHKWVSSLYEQQRKLEFDSNFNFME